MIALRTYEPDTAQAAEPWVAPLFHRPLSGDECACCCPGRAVFAVVVAPSAALPHPPDVLLCAHHTRASHAGLKRDSIAVYDAAGVLVGPDAAALAPLSAEPVGQPT